MAGLITIDQLLARPGFDDIDSGQGEALIVDASALVRDVAQGLLDDVEAPDAPPAVVAVIVNMIRRGWQNPRGLTQENLGDYGYSVGGNAVATLYLTAREKRIVRRAVNALGAGGLAMQGTLPRQPSEESVSGTDGDFDGFFP
jgi:hypothetical protein